MLKPRSAEIITSNPVFITHFIRKLKPHGIRTYTDIVQGYPEPKMRLLVDESQKTIASDLVTKYKEEFVSKMSKRK